MVFRNRLENICHCFTNFCFIYLVVISSSSSRAIEPLYNSNDDVISLQEESYDRTVLATSNAWLIEFYNSWCGHCARFAPTYKKLATDIKAWRPYVKVAAADCAQDYNTKLCQFFDIKMYPTMKFFPAFATSRVNGTDCSLVESVDLLQDRIVNYISDPDLSNIGSRRQQLLQPVKNIDDVWLSVDSENQNAILIFEQENSSLGRQVILDMFPYKGLVIQRMLTDNAAKYGITKVPSMFLIDRQDGTFKQLAVGTDRADFVKVLTNLLHTSKENPSEVKLPYVGESASPVGDQWVTRTNVFGTPEKKPGDSEPKPIDIIGPERKFNLLAENYLKVHEQDLESSLHYSLRHEVALSKTISNEQLVALRNYIKTLARYLPVQKPISLFLKKVDNWLQNEPGPIKGEDWLTTIEELQSPTEIYPDSLTWTGCQGSELKYRGYPCSLWTTFHTLTVSAYDQTVGKMDDTNHVKEVLLAIRGYVKFFFGCRECSQNFLKGAVHIEDRVTDAASGVLFLWRSHNRANYFLSGDLTEDPRHPKVQFPTSEQCPSCHASNDGDSSVKKFNEKEVLKFLLNMYASENLDPDSPRLITDPVLNDDNLKDLKDASHERQKKEDDLLFKDTILDLNGDKIVGTHLKTVSWSGLGKIDIGICVLFYLFCIGIIVVVYLRFIKHRSLRLLSNGCKLPV